MIEEVYVRCSIGGRGGSREGAHHQIRVRAHARDLSTERDDALGWIGGPQVLWWVLSFPRRIRWHLAQDPDLMARTRRQEASPARAKTRRGPTRRERKSCVLSEVRPS